MKLENSVYSVTPPSLFLNDNGPSLLLLGFDDSHVKRISQVFDKLFPENSITYYYDTAPINESTAPWARAVVNMVDFIIVNADTCNIAETYIATNALHDEDGASIYWIAETRANNVLCKLLISYGHVLCNTMEDLALVAAADLGLELH